VARHVLALAGELGMQLVVEGIETEAQRHCLVEMGVRTGQGYLRAEPLRADLLESWLKLQGAGFAA
jgi:EAL domain-containing protein (putative c-di-GMP-specific phosphodiesterase class I)